MDEGCRIDSHKNLESCLARFSNVTNQFSKCYLTTSWWQKANDRTNAEGQFKTKPFILIASCVYFALQWAGTAVWRSKISFSSYLSDLNFVFNLIIKRFNLPLNTFWCSVCVCVFSSSLPFLFHIILSRTNNDNNFTRPAHIKNFLTINLKDRCFSPTFNPLFVSLFPSYLQPSLPRILPQSLIRSLRPEQMHLFTGLLCNVCNLFIRHWLICEKKMQILHFCPSY